MKQFARRKFVQLGLTGASALLGGITSVMAAGKIYREENTFNIKDFGAVADGKTLNSQAIQKAIDKCYKSGGGRVVVPAGTWLTGSLVLKSKVNLHLEKDAIVLSSQKMKDFPLRVPRTPARYSKYMKRTTVYAQGEHDISVTGNGVFDGNHLLDESGDFKAQQADNPTFIWFDECENVLVKDVTFQHSVWWTQTYSRCKHVHVDHITVRENIMHNADGVDILDCEDFIVENCDINALDDGICMKGYTDRGCNRGTIRNNKVRSICNGIKMGTDSSGGFRNILIENNEVWNTGISALALECVDGGILENIVARNLTVNGSGTAIFIRLGNRNRKVYDSHTIQEGLIRNVHISNVKGTMQKCIKLNDEEKKKYNLDGFANSICGIPGMYVQDVTIENVDLTLLEGIWPIAPAEAALRAIPEEEKKYPENRMWGVLPAFGFYVRHVKGLRMKNISVAIKQDDGRPAFMLDDVHDSVFDNISASNNLLTPVIATHQNCTNLTLNLPKKPA